ncbi:MAG: aminotransferase class V-fold PLP-dependent enzyme [Acidimicrobiia bacterium]|nr:aminotransferase class V-fold PLP-dependent enzyme [Acidimicrobiia bacterium]
MSDLRRLWDLDPEVVHLNHGSFGACPRPVLDHQAALRRRMEHNPVEFLARRLDGMLDEARHALAGFIGADPEGLAFVPNATTGVNAVVGSLRLQRGDEIVITDHGYNACRNTIDRAASRSGAALRIASLPFPVVDPDAVVAAIMAQVSDRTRLVLVDHVTSPTALVLPVERIVAPLEARGIAVLVDGAHAPGMVPVDISAIGASYYTGNCHKWMCAPKGSGFLVVAPPLRDAVMPVVISHGFNSTRTDRSRFHLLFDWTGTDDPTPYLAVPRALETMASLLPGGWDGVRRHNRDLVLAGRAIIAAAVGGAEVLPPEGMIGSMASIPLRPGRGPEGDAAGGDRLGGELRERYGIEVPVPLWPRTPERVLRISAQVYNRIEEYERLAAALRDLEGTRR